MWKNEEDCRIYKLMRKTCIELLVKVDFAPFKAGSRDSTTIETTCVHTTAKQFYEEQESPPASKRKRRTARVVSCTWHVLSMGAGGEAERGTSWESTSEQG